MRIDEMFGDNLVQGLDKSIDSQLNELDMMGYDIYDPEVMGGLFSKIISGIRARRSSRGGGSGRKSIIRRIVSRIKRRKRAKKRKKSGYGMSFMTPEGTAMLTPEGISFEQRQKMIEAGLLPPTTKPGAGIMDQIKKNPMLLAIPAGLLLMMTMRGRRTPVVVAK